MSKEEAEPAGFRHALFAQVHRMRQKGESVRSMRQALRVHRRTVRRYLAAERAPTRATPPRRASLLDAHREHLEIR